jgi:formate dehydrogenase major subunit
MLLTRKASAAAVAQPRLANALSGALAKTMDRRSFLKRSGVTVGAGASFMTAAAHLPFNIIGRAEAQDAKKVEVKRTVCTHCSVGCAIDAVVENGVWVRQEPVFDSPINLGAHCAKGASIREHGVTHDSHRLKYPVKLEDGKWKKISWDQAYDEIAEKLKKIKSESGPDATFWIGSSKHNNEQSYLLCKWVRLFGTNNTDHQARICHSTTVSGIANTWGYGAMTNSYNDEQNSKCLLFFGSNAAEAHPVSMLHTLHAKENGAKVIVADPRFTRTAAKADKYVRVRSGTDVAFLFGLLHHIFKNGWEDKKYIHDRVYGMDKVREEVMAKYTPEAVEAATGVPEKEMYEVAKILAENRPGFIIWAMGQTQHSNGNAIVRASAVLMLALGNVGRSGGGCNIYRGHDNVQGATDLGPNPDSLPAYYGLAPGSFAHWARVWNVDLDWLKKQYASEPMMAKPGITVSRWHDAVLEKNENLDQDPNVRAVVFWGHAPNSQSRGLDMVEAMKKLDLMVVIDPYPSASAAMFAMVRKDGAYLLPAATQLECPGSVTASNRSLQWREKVIDPLFESRTDHMIMYQLAQKLGFADQLVGKRNGKQNIKLVKGKGGMEEPDIEDITREFNNGSWTIGYTGQSPERMQAHMRNMHVFDVKTLRARGGKDAKTGYDLTGDYFGMPWPCYGTAKIKHPGSPNLYDTTRHMMDGGNTFRANFGIEGESARRGRRRLQRFGDHYRLSRVRPCAAEEAGMVGRAHRRGEGRGRGQELEDRFVGRHPARRHEARLLSFRQRQGARRGVELPRRRAAAPRAAVLAQARPGGQVAHARRPEEPLAHAGAVQVGAAEGGGRQGARAVPADPHQRPHRGIRGRRRRDALQPLARRAAAGLLHRDQPEGRGRPRHPQRRVRVGEHTVGRQDQGEGQGHRGRRSGHGVHPVSLRRLVAGAGHAAVLPREGRADRARGGGEHGDDLRLRHRHHDAGNQDDPLSGRKSIKGK